MTTFLTWQVFISYLKPAELPEEVCQERLRQFDFECRAAHDEELDGRAGACLDDAARAAVQAAESTLRGVLRGGAPLGAATRDARAALDALCSVYGARHLACAMWRKKLAEHLPRQLQPQGAGGGDAERTEANLLLLDCSLELWRTQRRLLGPLHPECAQTLHVLACTIAAALAASPAALYAAHPEWGSAASAGHAERRARELHVAVARLFEAGARDGIEAWRRKNACLPVAPGE